VDAGTPPTETLTTELPFYQIGAAQDFLPNHVTLVREFQ
jgi:hypothetical protein